MSGLKLRCGTCGEFAEDFQGAVSAIKSDGWFEVFIECGRCNQVWGLIKSIADMEVLKEGRIYVEKETEKVKDCGGWALP
jgi:hypothetical protein